MDTTVPPHPPGCWPPSQPGRCPHWGPLPQIGESVHFPHYRCFSLLPSITDVQCTVSSIWVCVNSLGINSFYLAMVLFNNKSFSPLPCQEESSCRCQHQTCLAPAKEQWAFIPGSQAKPADHYIPGWATGRHAALDVPQPDHFLVFTCIGWYDKLTHWLGSWDYGFPNLLPTGHRRRPRTCWSSRPSTGNSRKVIKH